MLESVPHLSADGGFRMFQVWPSSESISWFLSKLLGFLTHCCSMVFLSSPALLQQSTFELRCLPMASLSNGTIR